MNRRLDDQGIIIPMLLALMILLSIIGIAAVALLRSNLGIAMNNERSQRAFNAAEAGVNYYLWHLSHNTADYKDGRTVPNTPDPSLGYGPYVHDYIGSDGKKWGTYTLWINPTGNGSTVVKVRSIGQASGSNIQRTIDTKIGAPSYASYGLVADGAVWFGNTETASGPVHSNQGIRLDGANTSDVTSARATYTPPYSLGGDGSVKNGVWCNPSVTTPVDCNSRSKVDWRYPVPSIDFNQVSADLCKMKKTAFADDSSTAALATQSTACSQVPTTRTNSYIPQYNSTGSYDVNRGYLVVLNANSYDLYGVNKVKDTTYPYDSALSPALIATNIALPASGVLFVEDNVWVRTGTNFNSRITLASARLASTSVTTNITIADDILYQSKNGSNAIGLVSEGSVYLAPYAPPASGSFVFEVDAALIAETGDVLYPSYYAGTSTCTRGWTAANQQFVFYGSVATRQLWTWTWLWGGACGDNAYSNAMGGYISGIANNSTQYDYNLMYAPPPLFPITSTYNVLEWREVVATP